MAFESINENGFYLRPGGAMEEANPTELGQDQYTQSSGITRAGRLVRMPGKRLIQRYGDRVLQIAGFGNAVILQHGTTLEMYPDACALAPTDDDQGNMVIVPVAQLPLHIIQVLQANDQTPDPWTAHPSYVVPYDFSPGARPIIYGDVSHSEYADAGVINDYYNRLLLEVRASGVVELDGGSNFGYWNKYSAKLSRIKTIGTLDLTAYKKKDWQQAALGGTIGVRDPNAAGGGVTTTNNYHFDVTELLGTVANVQVPYPKIDPTHWQVYSYGTNASGAVNEFYMYITHLALLPKQGPIYTL